MLSACVQQLSGSLTAAVRSSRQQVEVQRAAAAAIVLLTIPNPWHSHLRSHVSGIAAVRARIQQLHRQRGGLQRLALAGRAPYQRRQARRQLAPDQAPRNPPLQQHQRCTTCLRTFLQT